MLHAEREGKTALSQRTIVRVDLNDQVYDSLKERLLTREFGGGEKLSLQTLADELGVSRSPVHHALTRLVSEGLVLSERRGYMVRPLTARLRQPAKATAQPRPAKARWRAVAGPRSAQTWAAG